MENLLKQNIGIVTNKLVKTVKQNLRLNNKIISYLSIKLSVLLLYI